MLLTAIPYSLNWLLGLRSIDEVGRTCEWLTRKIGKLYRCWLIPTGNLRRQPGWAKLMVFVERLEAQLELLATIP